MALLRKASAIVFIGVLTVGLALPVRAQDNQPHLQAALQALKTAERELNAAEKDKGGHRARAVSLVRQAIAQVEAGMHYDLAHDKKKDSKK